jgi:hypothetical protein
MLLSLFLTLSCAGSALPPEVAASFAERPMRRLSAPGLEVYYPAEHKETAARITRRLSACLGRLRPKVKAPELIDPVVVLLTTAEFNNAFVSPVLAGSAPFMVVPLHASAEVFHFMGLGVGHLGDVACHEAVHYVQISQARGFWYFLNTLSGGLFSPQMFHERWFLEGLATYYEGHLGRRVGRPSSPIWRGMFASGVASEGGELDAAALGESRELLPFGGAYLVGSHFVEYLAERYGEEKLWAVTDLQARSWVSFLGVTLRFQWVYGQTIGGLLDEFSEHLARTVERRQRPKDQHVLARDLGYFARLAVSPAEGATATITASHDDEVRLTVREPGGRVRVSRRLIPLFPVRHILGTGPLEVSGLCFSADGRRLYFVTVDQGVTEQVSRLLAYDAHTGAEVGMWELPPALGGSVSPDGQSYFYVRMDGDRGNLVRLSLATSRHERLTDFQGAESLASPAVSPDGKSLAFSRWVGEGFDLFLRRENGELVRLTEDGLFNYGPRWIDAQRLVFLREHAGRAQAHTLDLAQGTIDRVTDAPYVSLDPAPLPDGRIAFLNRDGWGFTLDTVPAQSLGALPAQATYAASLAETQPQVYQEPALVVIEDAPYSQLDHLFWPTFHMPFVEYVEEVKEGQPTASRAFYGLALAGHDRLRLHTWGALGVYGGDREHMTLQLRYGTNLLAPLWLEARVAYAAKLPNTDQSVVVRAERVFYQTAVAMSLSGVDWHHGPTTMTQGSEGRRIGPGFQLRHGAVDGTPMAGATRGYVLALDAYGYRSLRGEKGNLGDLRAQTEVFLPLPLLARHSLRLSLTGRWLPGFDDGYLEIGGQVDGAAWDVAQKRQAGVDRAMEVDATFSEPVRGYEDRAFYGTDLLLGGATYRYPFIVDKGTASFFYLLPSFTLRELDLELFGTWAHSTDDGAGPHRAAGAALSASTLLWLVPLRGYYQYAHRFDDGLSDVHLFGLTLGL